MEHEDRADWLRRTMDTKPQSGSTVFESDVSRFELQASSAVEDDTAFDVLPDEDAHSAEATERNEVYIRDLITSALRDNVLLTQAEISSPDYETALSAAIDEERRKGVTDDSEDIHHFENVVTGNIAKAYVGRELQSAMASLESKLSKGGLDLVRGSLNNIKQLIQQETPNSLNQAVSHLRSMAQSSSFEGRASILRQIGRLGDAISRLIGTKNFIDQIK